MIPHPDCHPINLAPRDGTVILTELGFMKYLHWQGIKRGWASCSPQGALFSCVDRGFFYAKPTLWGEVPEWIGPD